jgi:hypothetical protein
VDPGSVDGLNLMTGSCAGVACGVCLVRLMRQGRLSDGEVYSH